MKLQWTRRALTDLSRLHHFQAVANPSAAARLIQVLVAAPERALAQPRIGEVIDEFSPREVRRILAGQYELRYEVLANRIVVLSIWHTREDR